MKLYGVVLYDDLSEYDYVRRVLHRTREEAQAVADANTYVEEDGARNWAHVIEFTLEEED